MSELTPLVFAIQQFENGEQDVYVVFNNTKKTFPQDDPTELLKTAFDAQQRWNAHVQSNGNGSGHKTETAQPEPTAMPSGEGEASSEAQVIDQQTADEKAVPAAEETTFPKFVQLALDSVARGEKRVIPIAIGAKKPLIKWAELDINTATTDEWDGLFLAWIYELGKQFPDANCATIAKDTERLFIDEDESERFRQGYEKFTGKPFPKTFTTSARQNRCQSHWLQTDRTRQLGNVSQASTLDAMISVRQHNLYVLAAGSTHKNGVDTYKIVDDTDAIPMPDDMVDYIVSIRTDLNQQTGDFTKKPEGWLDEPFIHGSIDVQLTAVAGHYVAAKNINDVNDLYVLLIAKLDKNGCFEKDGVTPFTYNTDDVRRIAHNASAWQTGEEKRKASELKLSEHEKQQQQAAQAAAVPPAAPKPVGDELLPVQKLTTDFLPSALVPWFNDICERMGVPLDFPAICGLATLAGVTGRRVFVFPKAKDKDWSEPIVLSGAIVALPGSIKTPVWNLLTKPVSAINKDWMREHEAATRKYKAETVEWERIEKRNEKLMEKGKPLLEQKPKPQEPGGCRRAIVNDATPEALHEICRDNPTGVLYFRDELSSWAAELEKEGREAQRGFFLSGMQGNDDRNVDRVSRTAGDAVLCFTVYGSFQPGLIREFLADVKNIDDGTVPRFHLMSWPDVPGEMEKLDREVNAEAKQTYTNIVRTLANLKPESVRMHFDAEAQVLFKEAMKKLDKKILAEDDLSIKCHLSKYSGALAKIAALFQLIDMVAKLPVLAVEVASFSGPTTQYQTTDLSGDYMIDAEHFRKAERFLGYLESHARRVYNSKLDPVQAAESHLVRRIMDGSLNGTFTRRDIERKRWYGVPKDVIGDALEGLTESGWLIETTGSQPSPKGGRPTRTWAVSEGALGAKP